jgi:hypothetical protein
VTHCFVCKAPTVDGFGWFCSEVCRDQDDENMLIQLQEFGFADFMDDCARCAPVPRQFTLRDD